MATDRCSFPDGVVIKPDGVNELDPCTYEEVECYKNVTIHVMKCMKCGHIELMWERQDNTEEVDPDDKPED